MHERDILIDMILSTLRDLLPKRPQLKLIIMSATIKADVFSRYFNDCPVLVIPGRTHPVEVYHLEDILEVLNHRVEQPENKNRAFRTGKPNQLDVNYQQMIEPYLTKMAADGKFPDHVITSMRLRLSEESPTALVLKLLQHISTQKRQGAILLFFPGKN